MSSLWMHNVQNIVHLEDSIFILVQMRLGKPLDNINFMYLRDKENEFKHNYFPFQDLNADLSGR